MGITQRTKSQTSTNRPSNGISSNHELNKKSGLLIENIKQSQTEPLMDEFRISEKEQKCQEIRRNCRFVPVETKSTRSPFPEWK